MKKQQPFKDHLRVIRSAVHAEPDELPPVGANVTCDDFLARQIEALGEAIQSARTYPRRRNLLDAFEEIGTVAQLLREKLRDQRILAHLGGDDEWFPSRETFADLDIIAKQAIALVKQNPPKQGRGVLYPNGRNRGPSPERLCALFVGMMWERLKGRWPPVKNKKAHHWCEVWWKLAGGSPRPGWGQNGTASVDVWRDHLRKARELRPPHPVGLCIQNNFLDGAFLRQRPKSRMVLPRDFYDHPVSALNRAKKKQK
jgi:hypothetical protein